MIVRWFTNLLLFYGRRNRLFSLRVCVFAEEGLLLIVSQGNVIRERNFLFLFLVYAPL